MQRTNWVNLNGKWDYAVTSLEAEVPTQWNGQLLVPFPIEAPLSGVQRKLTKSELLWYHRTFSKPALVHGERLLLHFGAVDWQATVLVNGKQVGEHKGGFTPFTCDVTDFLKNTDVQELTVRVWDPSESGYQPRGKQSSKPNRFFYTQVSGIWQTVWLEMVPATWIKSLSIEPESTLDGVVVTINTAGAKLEGGVKISMRDGNHEVATVSGGAGEKLKLKVTQPKLWSPDNPFLYNLLITLANGDQVESYAGIRKIEVRRDAEGFNRLFLNGQPLFQYGVLDQGWWPDGLYTAPTDEALRSDLETVKAMGMNLVRKHQKVEPARWYYWCDKLGLLAWQDIPAGENNGAEGRVNFKRETRDIIDACRNSPCIVSWNIFNSTAGLDNYGSAEFKELLTWVKSSDPSRLVDGTGGRNSWMGRDVDDLSDQHSYPWPAINPLESRRACVLGEFGGIEKAIPGHIWGRSDIDRPSDDVEGFRRHYADILNQVNLLRGQGLAAAVYTQLTDVENELNGLLTYDRAVNKLGSQWLATANKVLYVPSPKVNLLAGGELPWLFTTNSPDATWATLNTLDAHWDSASGPFGRSRESALVKTEVPSESVWLRREFKHSDKSEKVFVWVWGFDGASAEVRINGTVLPELAVRPGRLFRSAEITNGELLKDGRNLIAVEAKQPKGSAKASFEIRVFSVRTDQTAAMKTKGSQTAR